jgi:hypothetical protein
MHDKYLVSLEEDPETGDLILPFPEGLCDSLGWEVGDTLDWTENEDGTFSIKKKVVEETQLVLVEAVSTFRMRYLVEVPVGIDAYGRDKSEWAMDTVTMQEAREFSQEHLGEQIVSHRVVTKEEALKLCDQDNEYGKDWDEELKIKNFFTSYKDSKSDEQ